MKSAKAICLFSLSDTHAIYLDVGFSRFYSVSWARRIPALV